MIVRPEPKATRTASGLHLPEQREERLQVGRVIAVGPDAHDIRAGDRVAFGAHAGAEIDLRAGESVLSLHAPEVLFAIEGPQTPSSTWSDEL